MTIRIECDLEAFEKKKVWIDFRDDRWPFKDRRQVTSLADDESLLVVASYIEDWSMVDVDGKAVPFDSEKGLDNFLMLDDREMIPWVFSAWFQARRTRVEVSKN